MSYNDDILEGDDALKGISGGTTASNKKRTPRPIKPPGVYVNGKATAKSERENMASFKESPFEQEQDSFPTNSHLEKKSLKMIESNFEEMEELANNGSSEFQEYLDYSVTTREQLDGDVANVLELLDRAAEKVNLMHKEVTKTPTVETESNTFDNETLLLLVEERNHEVELQLTHVWDELIRKDEAQRLLAANFETTQQSFLESQSNAAVEISQANAQLNMYKSQVKELHDELENTKIEAGSLHEQVDALRQKLSMEEASKKSLKGQLERAHAEAKKREAVQQDRSEIRSQMKEAIKLSKFTSTVSVFAWYMQVRTLTLKLSQSEATRPPANAFGNARSFGELDHAAAPLSSAAVMLGHSNSKVGRLVLEQGWKGKEEIKEYLQGTMGVEAGGIDEVSDRIETLTSRERAQRELNAHLLSTIAGMKETIQVYCRIRPHSEKERQQDKSDSSSSKNLSPGSMQRGVQALGVAEVGVYDTYAQSWRGFAFDRVWGPETSQVDLFLEIEPLALSVVDGEPCCILAYGQTGSGKTYTMHGDGDQNLGISYRTVHKIFSLLDLHKQTHAQNGDNFEYKLQVSIVEVYNEEVHDLLAFAQSPTSRRPSGSSLGSSAAPLEVRAGTGGAETVVVGLSWHHTASLEDAVSLFDLGCAARATASTTLNHSSSRSHMVMTIEVTSCLNQVAPKSAKLHLVDLAGSERVKQSEATGQTLREAQNINKSLSALGDVMEALDSKASFVPYRNSKLTLLLQGCLGGGPSRTAMLVTCCPTKSTAEESSFTLQFGSRCRRIASVSTASSPASHVRNLEETLKTTRNELKALSQKNEAGGQNELVKRLEAEKSELIAALSALRKELPLQREKQSAPPPPPPSAPSPSPLMTARFSSARQHRSKPSSPSSSPSQSSLRTRSSNLDSHHTAASPIPSSPSSGPRNRPNPSSSSNNGVPSYSASVANIKADGKSKTKKPIGSEESVEASNGVQSTSSIRTFMRMRQNRSASKDSVDSGDLTNKRKPPPPPKGARDLAAGPSRRTPSAGDVGYGFISASGATTPRSASSGDNVVRPQGSESRRSSPSSRFFGKLSSSGELRGASGGSSSRLRSNSNERNDPSPASRRAEAAKKHAARMQAVRASSGKGRWGNSI